MDRTASPQHQGERRRIVICKHGPADSMDQAMLVGGGHARVESVVTLAEAMTLCLRDGVDFLIVNMFSFTSAELTALMMFREIRPGQRVLIFCPEEAVPMLVSADLADECHPIALEKGARDRPRRARA